MSCHRQDYTAPVFIASFNHDQVLYALRSYIKSTLYITQSKESIIPDTMKLQIASYSFFLSVFSLQSFATFTPQLTTATTYATIAPPSTTPITQVGAAIRVTGDPKMDLEGTVNCNLTSFLLGQACCMMIFLFFRLMFSLTNACVIAGTTCAIAPVEFHFKCA